MNAEASFSTQRPSVRHLMWLIFALILSVHLCGCVDERTKHQALVSGAITQLTPLIQALDTYASRQGEYPKTFRELVASGYLSEAPKCPDMGGQGGDLLYQTDPLQTFFYLVVAYKFDTWVYHLHYVSFRGRWETTKYPPKMPDLVALGMGLRYQHSPSASNLKSAIDAIVVNSQGVGSLLPVRRSLVTNALGAGVSTVLPPTLAGVDQHGDRYEATNQPGCAYVVRYRQRDATPELITKEGVLGNTQEVDAIYEVHRNEATGNEDWSLCRDF